MGGSGSKGRFVSRKFSDGRKEVPVTVQEEYFIHNVVSGNVKNVSKILFDSSDPSVVYRRCRSRDLGACGNESPLTHEVVEESSVAGDLGNGKIVSNRSKSAPMGSCGLSDSEGKKKGRKGHRKYAYLKTSNFLNERFIYEGDDRIGRLASDGGTWTVEKVSFMGFEVFFRRLSNLLTPSSFFFFSFAD